MKSNWYEKARAFFAFVGMLWVFSVVVKVADYHGIYLGSSHHDIPAYYR